MTTTPAIIDQYADRYAQQYALPTPLILAMIDVESAGSPWATRYEPHYRYCWDVAARKPLTLSRVEAAAPGAPSGFPSFRYSSADTEWAHQRTSWGLMQVMGAVAREYGLTHPLPTLCRPDRGIEYGCRHLARLRDRLFEVYGWGGVLDAYNDGTGRIERPRDYPHLVAEASTEARRILEL
jgi:soluble lytic murein transglycosylase-like protein